MLPPLCSFRIITANFIVVKSNFQKNKNFCLAILPKKYPSVIMNKSQLTEAAMAPSFAYHKSPVPYFTSPLLDSYGIPHLFATRHGGVSTGVFESLNFAAGSGDERDSFENLFKNHAIAANAIGFGADDIVRTRQGHTDVVEIVGVSHKGIGLSKPQFDYDVDGLVTREKGVLLSVRSADCVPVLLYDVKKDIAGAVHSGWLGTKKQISVKAVELFKSFGSNPEDILVAMGPAIKSCCYQVGEEFYNHFPGHLSAFSVKNSKIYLELTDIIAKDLINIGIKNENMDICPLCTCCEEEYFFSHRRQGPNRGTMAAFIAV